jgi:hypothetical protein
VKEATALDHTEYWEGDGVVLCAQIWDGLALPDAAPGMPTCRVVAIQDLRYREPLLSASPPALSAAMLLPLRRDRCPVEQLPLTAK